MGNYYQMTGEETLQELNGTVEPLSASQVKEHQEKYGRNELVEGKKKTTLQIFLEQYKDFLVLILIVSAVVSLFLGETESAAVSSAAGQTSASTSVGIISQKSSGDAQPTEGTYTVNVNTKKIHSPSCSYAMRTSSENKKEISASELSSYLNNGYSVCSKCNAGR